MLKNVTITLPEQTALWARRQAADANMSLAKYVGSVLDEQMRRAGSYQDAKRAVLKMRDFDFGGDSSKRAGREEIHARK